MAMGRAERAEKESRYKGSDAITKVLRSRAELGLKNQEKNLEFNVGGEKKSMVSLYHKRGDVREVGKTSTRSSGGLVDGLDRR